MHPLKQRVVALRRRVRWLVAVYGVSWVVGTVVAVAVALGLVDYVFRFQDVGIRLIFSVFLVGVLGWTSYRFLVRGLRARWGDVELAGRIERRFPALGDRLASAVEFLDQPEDDPTAGSLALRRAVIVQATADTETLDFSQVLNTGPTFRAAVWSAAICLAAVILIVLSPRYCAIAMARLANPLGSLTWPQKTHLVIRVPQRPVIGRGQAFEVEVVDAQGAKLPDEVRIHYRFTSPDGAAKEETEPMHFLGDAMTARRENVTLPFAFRVEGGDDQSMGWIDVEVLEPPAARAVAVKLYPPAYTGLPVESSGTLIRALVGTRVAITAQATKPLESAVLCLDGGRQISARLSDDGLSITVAADGPDPLVVEKSGSYWPRLTDREGLTSDGENRWEIRAVADAPPSVIIEQPTSTIYVTPGAVVPVRVAAKDDLAVRSVSLVAQRPEQSDAAPWVFSLYEGPEKVASQKADFSSGAELGENLPAIEYRWDLGPLGLRPGMQVNFDAAATDYRPQTSRSEPRRLAIITPEELADRIAGRQSVILAELARILQLQRDGHKQVSALEIQVAQVGRLAQLELDRLRSAELNQRQINRTLTSRSEGLPVHVLGLLADLENNKIDSPDVRRRMEAMLAELDRLDRDHLPIIERELTGAIKATQIQLEEKPAAGDAPAGPSVAPALATAGKHQQQVIESLEQMLGRLTQWENFRRFHHELSQLLREQEELARRSAELAPGTFAKDFKDLLPQQQADLRVLARQQRDLARRLDRIQQEMEETVARLDESDPLAAETVSDALHRARELAISGTMLAGSGDLEQNRMGRAVAGQKKIVDDLQEVLDILANRRESELARLVKKLREAETDLANLAARQEGLRKQIEAAAGQPEPERKRQLEKLARDQRQLEERAQRTARRLERLMADRAGRTTQKAAGHMGQAGAQAGQGRGAQAADQAKQAGDALQDAQKQLAQRRFQAEVELVTEQLARLQDTLRHLQTQQKSVLDETVRLEGLQQSQGSLTPAQDASLVDLVRQQRLLREDAVAQSEKLSAAKAFALALSGTADDMARAADLLTRRQTGQPTQRAEQSALARLALLLDALEPEKPSDDKNASGGAGNPNAQQGNPPGGVQALAELKLLRLMQQQINQETRDLEQTFGGVEKLDEAARREYEDLAQQQGQLAELLMEMIAPQGDREDNPAALPKPSEPKEEPPLKPLEEFP